MSKSQIEKINDILNPNASRAFMFRKPFVVENYVYTTNRYSIARVEKQNQYFDLHITEVQRERVLALFNFKRKQEFSINIKQLESALSKVPKIHKKNEKSVVCDECDGDGQVLWEYGYYKKMFDCPKCDGDGFINREIITDELIPDPEYVFRLNEKVFKQNRIKEIIAIAQLLNEPNLKWFTGVKLGCLFQIKDVELIVMECVNPSKKIINIKS